MLVPNTLRYTSDTAVGRTAGAGDGSADHDQLIRDDDATAVGLRVGLARSAAVASYSAPSVCLSVCVWRQAQPGRSMFCLRHNRPARSPSRRHCATGGPHNRMKLWCGNNFKRLLDTRIAVSSTVTFWSFLEVYLLIIKHEVSPVD